MKPKIIFKTIIDLFAPGMAVIGTIWSVMEILEKYYSDTPFINFYQNHISCMLIPGILAVVINVVCLLNYERKVSFTIKDAKITIEIGDILRKRDGVIVVGINNQWNTNGAQIGKSSIHKALLDKYGQDRLDAAFAKGKTEAERLFFPEEIGGKEYLFLRMSDLIHNNAASTTIDQMQKALDELFYHQDYLSMYGGRIYFPVLGTGEGGICLNRVKTIEFMVNRFWKFQKQINRNSIVKIKELHIVIYWKDFNRKEWNQIKQWVDKIGQYCMECQMFQSGEEVEC